MSQWYSYKTSTIGKYKNFVKFANKKAKTLNMPVVFDIPFWFDEVPSYGEGETVTFYEKGRSYMNKQLEIAKRKLGSKPAFSGFAIHDYNGWKGLRP